MPRIRCRYVDCVYLESGFCGADQIDLDPDLGCLTYSQEEEEALPKEEEWEEEALDEEGTWDEDELEEDEFEEEDFEEDDDDDDDDEEW